MREHLRRLLHRLGFDLVAMGAHRVGESMPAPRVREEFRELLGGYALQVLLDHFRFDSVLDIGSGEGRHAEILRRHGKRVTTVDFGRSIYYERGQRAEDGLIGDYLTLDVGGPYDAVWASHVLEHQPNPHQFLRKVFGDLAEGGVLAVTLPPLRHELVGGHVTLWNAGVLLYQLVLAGFDCREAHVRSYGYNVSVLLRKRAVTLPELDYDSGDIDRLRPFLPDGLRERCWGRIEALNWRFEA